MKVSINRVTRHLDPPSKRYLLSGYRVLFAVESNLIRSYVYVKNKQEGRKYAIKILCLYIHSEKGDTTKVTCEYTVLFQTPNIGLHLQQRNFGVKDMSCCCLSAKISKFVVLSADIVCRNYSIFSNLICTSFCRFLKRKKKLVRGSNPHLSFNRPLPTSLTDLVMSDDGESDKK